MYAKNDENSDSACDAVDILVEGAILMIETGRIYPMSSSDIVNEFGKSRQHWSRLMRQGRIWSQETGRGRITTNVHVEDYLRSKKK